MHRVAFVVALALAWPAAAQKVTRPPAAPAVFEAAQAERFRRTEQDLNARADRHDAELAAYAGECPATLRSDDVRLPGCQARRSAVLAPIRNSYNPALKSYRDEARAALQALIAGLDEELASVQHAIRNIGFDATAAAFEEWEQLSAEAKQAMIDEALGAVLTLTSSPEVGARLGEVFDRVVSRKLAAPASWNPWNVHEQIRELERLGVTDPYFHGLLRSVAAARDKPEFVERATAMFKHTTQAYKHGKAAASLAAAHGWQERNWAMTSACLTVLSDKTWIRPERALKWLATESGRKALLGLKAGMSSANVGFRLAQLYTLTGSLEAMSDLPEQQLKSLERLDERLREIVGRRKMAKAELARFT